ncbi:RagB/SusD family nutrient uptake outer membrane protein [Pseudarcicella hirudinis]|nr:RagB/SusD family nutrient uptake outer membrane protein [Pseudarcicella hirudinis]
MRNSLKRPLFFMALAGGLSLLSIGCADLKETPDFVSPENFYKSEADAVAAINGAYRPINDEWYDNPYNRSVFDCALGIQSGYEKGPLYYRQGGYVASDEYIDSYWAQNYRGINRTNIVLDKLPGVKMDDAVKKRISGEAHFLRAFYYYCLTVYFENIPVIDKPTRELGNYPTNDGGKKKALDLMISDLKAAEGELPATMTDANAGRPTKWAAKTLLSKVYLESGEWQNAADKAKEVIDQSGLTLFTNFVDNFSVEKKNTGERLFEMQCNYDVNPDIYQNLHAHFTPTDWDGSDPNSNVPGDGATASGWADAWIVGSNDFRDIFEAGDNRIPVTFMEKYRSKNANNQMVSYDRNAKSPFVAQGSPDRTFKNVIYQKWIEYNIGGWQKTKKNITLLRLADAYLAHSEACAKGATGDAYMGINKIRSRAGLTALSGLTKDALVNATLVETLREFAGEGWAFPTLRRFGKIAEYTKKYAGRDVDETKYRVLPIPIVEINANPKIKQNQGW